MLMTPKNPATEIYPAVDYAHAMEVTDAQRLLFVSGTMGLDGKGNAPEGLDDQLALLWSNIRRILAEANMTTDNIVRLTSYLRHASFAQANAKARLEALGERRVPTTAIVVETLVPEWLVEIEAVAAS
ncbi:MAG: 2-iminobutanoate/2-iminopropanoate deaminase [Rhodospirillaceae bacterium]|jgi:2-iminobutanoate/2-iminopropanoate deaminase|nr:2-iminobutanoate/2-iminopropanoate deaminase [Rhodospirillaceae bacterium]